MSRTVQLLSLITTMVFCGSAGAQEQFGGGPPAESTRPMMRIQPAGPIRRIPPAFAPTPARSPSIFSSSPGDGNAAGRDICSQLSRYDMAPPRIDVADLGRNPLGGVYVVSGSVEGKCLVEAGLFEDGRKMQNIALETTTRFRRYDFQLRVRAGHRSEIRVYNSSGERDAVDVSR